MLQVYHGDLAARNILLTTDLTAKVGDFGLSKQLDMEEYNCYVQKKEVRLTTLETRYKALPYNVTNAITYDIFGPFSALLHQNYIRYNVQLI